MGELDRKHRYDFFKGFITSLGKKNLFDFEVVKDHEIFNIFRTDILKKIALEIDNKEGS